MDGSFAGLGSLVLENKPTEGGAAAAIAAPAAKGKGKGKAGEAAGAGANKIKSLKKKLGYQHRAGAPS
jgi:hypothetical protein